MSDSEEQSLTSVESSWQSSSSAVAFYKATTDAGSSAAEDAAIARRCFIICVANTRCDGCQRLLHEPRPHTFCLRCMNMSYEELDGGASSGRSGSTSTRLLVVWVIIAKIFAILSVVLVAIWFGVYEGGFSWSEHLFNYHPLFMTIGFIYLFGDAMLVFRVLPGVKRRTQKWVHLALNLLALICVGVGLHGVFGLHGPTLYSLHSWIGIATVIFFALQWLCGVIFFMFPWLSGKKKSAYKPAHVFWGVALFAMAGAAVLTGAMEELKNKLTAAEYSSFTAEGLVANVFGLLVIATVITTSYIVTADFKTGYKQEEERIPIN